MSEATLMIKHTWFPNRVVQPLQNGGMGQGWVVLSVTGETFNHVQDSSTKSLATGTWHCMHAV